MFFVAWYRLISSRLYELTCLRKRVIWAPRALNLSCGLAGRCAAASAMSASFCAYGFALMRIYVMTYPYLRVVASP